MEGTALTEARRHRVGMWEAESSGGLRTEGWLVLGGGEGRVECGRGGGPHCQHQDAEGRGPQGPG